MKKKNTHFHKINEEKKGKEKKSRHGQAIKWQQR